MMAQPLDGARASLLSTARGAFALDGVKGFYRGLGPTFLRAFPANASAFFVYEATMRLLGAEKVCAWSIFCGRVRGLTVTSDASLKGSL